MESETRYKRIYRTFESDDRKKSWDLFIRQDKDKTTVSTIQSNRIAENEEHTLSCFMREEHGVVVLEIWEGFVGDTLKKYERRFITNVEYNAGTLLMSETYANAVNLNNHVSQIAELSERLIDFGKMQMKKKQKTL